MRTRIVSLGEFKQARDHVKITMIAEDFDDARLARTLRANFEVYGYSALSHAAALNSFAIVSIFSAMRDKRSVHITGAVSRRLLINLEEFQRAFASWAPDRYSVVEFTADEELVGARLDTEEPAIAAFSGGVDAAFTVWRHLKEKTVARPKKIRSVMLVHGFDIPVTDNKAFSIALDSASRMIDGLGLNLYYVKTDVRYHFQPDWEYSFGTGLAACLHLFSDEHSHGLVGSDEPYSKLIFPWGSNPVTNHLLSTRSFEINYDGGGFSRTEKVAAIGDWSAGLSDLRVCWEGDIPGRNCGKCEKCTRTILNSRAAGLPKPSCFETDVDDQQIEIIPLRNSVQRAYLEDILHNARKRGIDEEWVNAVARRIRQ